MILESPVCMLQLLQYHIVPNMTLTTSEIKAGQTLTTALSGQTLEVWIGCQAGLPSMFTLCQHLIHCNIVFEQGPL